MAEMRSPTRQKPKHVLRGISVEIGEDAAGLANRAEIMLYSGSRAYSYPRNKSGWTMIV
jgi:hypothetical protein